MIRRDARGGAHNICREDGFTLTEMSIVIIILGIILAIAGLNISNISREINLNAARKQIESALNRAKTAARQENVTYSLVIYSAGNADNPSSYEFLRNSLVEGAWQMMPADLSVSGERLVEESGHWYAKLQGNVQVTGTETLTVTFKPVGTIMQVTPATIGLRVGNQTGSVTIDALGRVSIN